MSKTELNLFARSHDRKDSDPDILNRIIRSPACRLGTALSVYVRGKPTYFLGRPEGSLAPEETETAAFLAMLRDRINAGRYRHDPACPCVDRAFLVRSLAAPASELDRAPWLIDAARVADEIALETAARARRDRRRGTPARRGLPELVPADPPPAPRQGRMIRAALRLRQLLARWSLFR